MKLKLIILLFFFTGILSAQVRPDQQSAQPTITDSLATYGQESGTLEKYYFIDQRDYFIDSLSTGLGAVKDTVRLSNTKFGTIDRDLKFTTAPSGPTLREKTEGYFNNDTLLYFYDPRIDKYVKHKDLLTVDDFGAIPDDGLSDHTAVLNAITYADTSTNQSLIVFNKGVYNLYSPDVVDGEVINVESVDSITFVGQGKGQTVLKGKIDVTNDAIKLFRLRDAPYVGFMNMTMQAENEPAYSMLSTDSENDSLYNTNNAIHIIANSSTPSDGFFIDNVEFKFFYGSVVTISDALEDWYITNCDWYKCMRHVGANGIVQPAGILINGNAIKGRIEQCDFIDILDLSGTKSHATYIGGAEKVKIIHCLYENTRRNLDPNSNGSCGAQIFSGTNRNIEYVDCTFNNVRNNTASGNFVVYKNCYFINTWVDISTDDVLIEGCTFEKTWDWMASGGVLNAKDLIERLQVQNCQFNYPIDSLTSNYGWGISSGGGNSTGGGDHWHIEGNTFTNVERGIVLGRASPGSSTSVDSSYIGNNTFRFEKDGDIGIELIFAKHNVIENNIGVNETNNTADLIIDSNAAAAGDVTPNYITTPIETNSGIGYSVSHNVLTTVSSTGTDQKIGTITEDDVYLITNNTNRVTIDSTGKVGIGQDPVLQLDVKGSTDVVERIESSGTKVWSEWHNSTTGNTSGSDGLYMGIDGTGAYLVNRESAGAFRIGSGNQSIVLMNGLNGDFSLYEDDGLTIGVTWDASAERLGIGTNSPAEVFHLQSSLDLESLMRTTGASANIYYTLENSGDAADAWAFGRHNDGTFRLNHSTGSTYPSGTTTNYLQFQTDGDMVLTANIIIDSGNNIIIATGSGSPEGSLTAGIGSTYHRSDGGASTSFYVKESGTGNTGWVAK